MKEIAMLRGIPKEIFSDKDLNFTSNFWKGLFIGFKTNMNLSPTYHPQIDEQNTRFNQAILDMLRMYVMDQPLKWEYYLYLVDFSYNNGNHASLKMSPFEVFYGRKCDTPISWDNLVERVIIGP